MSSPYGGKGVNGSPRITLPSDMDAAVVASVNGALRSLADYIAYLWGTLIFIILGTITARVIPSGNWVGAAWNGTTWVAIAWNATNFCATSPDGITWTSRTMPATADWRSVAWNGTVFCAVANTTVAATSPDGITWTARTMPTSATWHDIVWNGSYFLATSNGTAAATSPDGITWTARTLPAVGGAAPAWSAERSLWCACLGAGVIYTSPDTISWTLRTAPSTYYFTVWTGGFFIAVSNVGGAAATSPDGGTWTAAASVPANFNSCTSANGVLLATTNGSATLQISKDGALTWMTRTLPAASAWGAIGWNGSYFVFLNSAAAQTASASSAAL